MLNYFFIHVTNILIKKVTFFYQTIEIIIYYIYLFSNNKYYVNLLNLIVIINM